MRYWEHKQLDPRLVYSKRRYTFPNNSSQALLSKTHLTEFWVNTEPLVRLQILGGLGSIVDTALRDSAVESQEKTNVPVATPPLSVSTFRRPRKGSDATRNSVFPIHDIRLLSALVDFSMEKKAVEFLFAAHADKSKVNHRAFIEILYFSPLKTAGRCMEYHSAEVNLLFYRNSNKLCAASHWLYHTKGLYGEAKNGFDLRRRIRKEEETKFIAQREEKERKQQEENIQAKTCCFFYSKEKAEASHSF